MEPAVPTGELNRWFEGMLAKHPPPLVDGRRIKPRFATMPKARPPTVVGSARGRRQLPEEYRRYLVNGFREAFAMPGVPIRLQTRGPRTPMRNRTIGEVRAMHSRVGLAAPFGQNAPAPGRRGGAGGRARGGRRRRAPGADQRLPLGVGGPPRPCEGRPWRPLRTNRAGRGAGEGVAEHCVEAEGAVVAGRAVAGHGARGAGQVGSQRLPPGAGQWRPGAAGEATLHGGRSSALDTPG